MSDNDYAYHATPPLFRFGQDSAQFDAQSWRSPLNFNTPSSSLHPVSYGEEYDDVTELFELPDEDSLNEALRSQKDKNVRRRSSKACDQCRKSKCRCERSHPDDPCRNCEILGTKCTFLGPSRKRGPPKGYIDAIEARLHQTEALLGILISSKDERAKGLLDELAKDPFAREIINRVDNSPYGSKGGKSGKQAPQPGAKARFTAASGRLTAPPSDMLASYPASGTQSPTKEDEAPDLATTHPSSEWQRHVSSMLSTVAMQRSPGALADASMQEAPAHAEESFGRRQRRRMEGSMVARSAAAGSTHGGGDVALSPAGSSSSKAYPPSGGAGASVSSDDEAEEEALREAVGQLSLNEDEQVRWHGKASGLHLLSDKARLDTRNEGGIWRFPKARVWPPLPGTIEASMSAGVDEDVGLLPSKETQELLLDLYFTYVHPSFPIIHKKEFFEIFRNEKAGPDSPSASSPASATSDAPPNKSSSPLTRRPRQIPTLLLLTMFSIAARYASHTTLPTHTPPAPPSGDRSMWTAGDDFLDRAKVILDRSYASSRPSTCQALLLLGFREIGIGAMALAWAYVGMAVRMAQDLGLHRAADGWARVSLGGRLFRDWELIERKRIWFGCVIMDKYVSTYIGRPLAIYERDFDTTMPSENDSEEMEQWAPHPSAAVDTGDSPPSPSTTMTPRAPVTSHVISCFIASAGLSGLLGKIVESLYAVRPVASRHAEATRIEAALDKWYIELPEHLRLDPSSSPPHVLTLHMQYWCVVLLLHRPFIRSKVAKSKQSNSSEASDETDARASAERSYELCASAATHIAKIVSQYAENHCLKRSAVFLCYYVFSAGIMHVTSLSTYPNDPQAQDGLRKCMDSLHRMEIVWPSAGRALELLRGSKLYRDQVEAERRLSLHPDRQQQKRVAERELDDALELRYQVHLPGAAVTMASLGGGSVGRRARMHSRVLGGGGHVGDPTTAAGAMGFSSVMGDGGGLGAALFPAMYDPWAVEVDPQYPATLSTSVLPQLYSTGFVDESHGAHQAYTLQHPQPYSISMAGHAGGQTQQQHYPQRTQKQTTPIYPQFWNDFSSATFPQLGYELPSSTTMSGVGSEGDVGEVRAREIASMMMPYPMAEQYDMYDRR